MARPLLFTAPWRRAWSSLRRSPALLGAAAATGVVIGMVASAPVLFVSSVGAGAVQQQYAHTCPASSGITMKVKHVRAVADGSAATDPLDVLTAAVAADPAFAPPEAVRGDYSPSVASFAGRTQQIGFLTRSGWHDHVEMLTAEVPGDVWLPDTVAAALDIEPGDVVEVRTSNGGDTSLTVAGVFRDLATRPLNSFWCAAATAIQPLNYFSEIVPPPMAIVEADTFSALPLRFSLERSFERYVAEFAHPPHTLTEAEQDAAAVAGVKARLSDQQPVPRVIASIDRIAARSHAVRDAVRDTTWLLAALAIVCALALAAVLGLLWQRVRRNSCIALATIGVSPAALGVKAALETGLAVTAGAAVGVVAARGTLSAWAPATQLEPGALASAVAAGLAAAATGLLLVALTVAVSCRSLLRHASPAPRGWVRFVQFVPFEVGLALVAWNAERSLGTVSLVQLDGTRVLGTSSSVLLLPLAVLALGAALTARLWWWATRRPRSNDVPSRLSQRLALRRVQHGSRAGTALLGVGTLALGVSVFGVAMNTSLERTGAAKTGVFVGSDVSMVIVNSLPAGVPDASEVWARTDMQYAGRTVDLIAVDPSTFAAVAFWDDSFADRPLTDLLRDLDTAEPEAAARVIAVGDVPDSGDISDPRTTNGPLSARVVARVHAFPGAHAKNPTLIMTRAVAEVGPIKFRHFVWARGGFAEWRQRLQELGAGPLLGVSRQDAVDASVLKFTAWSFDFMKALGMFVGALVMAALVLHLAARQRQQALAFTFLRRMGFDGRRHWWALVLEVGAMMLATFLLGSALALVCVRIVSPHVDPLPIVPPNPLMVVPWGAIAVTGAVVALVVSVGAAVAQWSGGRVDVSELLRDGS